MTTTRNDVPKDLPSLPSRQTVSKLSKLSHELGGAILLENMYSSSVLNDVKRVVIIGSSVINEAASKDRYFKVLSVIVSGLRVFISIPPSKLSYYAS
jgi:hypothetical protein